MGQTKTETAAAAQTREARFAGHKATAHALMDCIEKDMESLDPRGDAEMAHLAYKIREIAETVRMWSVNRPDFEDHEARISITEDLSELGVGGGR